MLQPKQLLILLLIICCCSCSRTNKYPYAIKDFRGKLQPYLTRMVTKGIVMTGEVITAIWEHPCPAYARLREKIKTKAQAILKRNISIQVDPIDEPVDTIKAVIRW